MRAWRIVRLAYAAEPLSGEGAARWGGRWNSAGTPMVYASTSRSLAVLEILVHVVRDDIPLDAVLVPIDVPDQLITEVEPLPTGWSEPSRLTETCRIGDLWIQQYASLAMLVPSAVIPAERNLLINPLHAKFGQVQVGEPEPNAFDRRLFELR